MNRQPFYGIKLRVFLRKVLVQGIYKLLAADAVYNTSLFQRFHLGRRAANTVHSSSHQDIGGIDICTEQFSSLSPLGVVNVARGIKDVASSGPETDRKSISPPWSAIRYSRWTVMPLSVAL